MKYTDKYGTGGEASVHRVRMIWLLLSFILFTFFTYEVGYADVTYSCENGFHEFESHVRVLNTEDTQGEVENVCVRCGYSYIEYLPATGHEYGEWETVDEDAQTRIQTQKRICRQCYRSEFREIAMKPKWQANQMDYLLSAAIMGIWGYGALALWYDSLVINWYKKNSRTERGA